ncbi:MAG: hypothetical protein AAGG68_25125 [Bacteroidota bacterium]
MKNGVRTDEYFRNAEEGQNKAAEWVELARMGYILPTPLSHLISSCQLSNRRK